MELSRRNFLKTGVFGATAMTAMPFGIRPALATVCVPTVCDITAGQNIFAGTITVSNTSTHLTITIALTDGVVFAAGTEQVKIWTGTDFLLMPHNTPGNPKIGKFPIKSSKDPYPDVYVYDDTGSSYSITISLQDAGIISPLGCGSILHVVAHLDVVVGTEGETAFGGCEEGLETPDSGPAKRWGFYLDHVICCEDPVVDPPVLGGCETAFAKGNWVWVKDSNKANPEKLPTLYLLKNRWGWAINLKEGGSHVYPIFAGAGLNRTSGRTPVGTLTVNWFDSNADDLPDMVTITYQLASGYRLAETHVYASHLPPPTTAPGQYGNNHNYFLACDNETFDQYGPLALVDNVGSETPALDVCKTGAGTVTNGVPGTCSGVWIIAHAVVCDAAICTP